MVVDSSTTNAKAAAISSIIKVVPKLQCYF